MKFLPIIAALLLFAQTVLADTCSPDFMNTNRTNEYALPRSQMCSGCRNLYGFPKDFRNFAFNWIVHGGMGGTGGHTAYNSINRLFLQNDPIRISAPVCNRLGQCATVNVVTDFDTLDVFRRGIVVIVNHGIVDWRVSVTAANGDVLAPETYHPGQGMLPVPHSSTVDPKRGKCLNNLGRERPLDSEMIRTIGQSALQESQSWFSNPVAWGFFTPTYRCGTATVSGGGSLTTCAFF